ncbi:MAG: N,N-dimethylformamidase, partial [Rhizobiales bacterium]|nr:N,N-dimethylformamidase [Hyphomicrobiales bacterium]
AIDPGSWGYAPVQANCDKGLSIQTYVFSTLSGKAQFIMGTWSENDKTGIGLRLRSDHCLEAVLGDGNSVVTVAIDMPLLERHWYHIAAIYCSDTGTLQIVQNPVKGHIQSVQKRLTIKADAANIKLKIVDGVSFAAVRYAARRLGRHAPFLVRDHFNGKIDSPYIIARALTDVEIDQIAVNNNCSDPDILGMWNFSAKMGTETLQDISTQENDGVIYNMPTRASTGYNWHGQEMNWHNAPHLYGAIHFHDDDVHDCGWKFQHKLNLTSLDISSGVYALKLIAGELKFYVPFFVTPSQTQSKAKVAFLASTATYQVYSNLKARLTRDIWEVSQGRLIQMDMIDMYLFDHPEIGLSTYDKHSDGSGVAYVSRLRPSTTIRPDGRLWNFTADLFYIDWLERLGMDYDLITDECLHDSVMALDGYDVLITGSHPEYYTGAMMQSLEVFLAKGGRMMYMGGNGFYWKCAYHPEAKGVIELRRAEDGLRAWAAEPGEYYHSSDGEYGGLWRRNGITPQMLTGVGFIAQGFDSSSYYRKLEASNNPRVAFIFNGIEGDIIGDFGLMGGGAAGMEIDAADYELGTPAHALILARSEGHSNVYEIVNEEITLAHAATDVLHNSAIRAEMTFFETIAGGAVFCTGSIAFAGALAFNNFDNQCAHLAQNVLNRFTSQTPFKISNHQLNPKKGP